MLFTQWSVFSQTIFILICIRSVGTQTEEVGAQTEEGGDRGTGPRTEKLSICKPVARFSVLSLYCEDRFYPICNIPALPCCLSLQRPRYMHR